MSSDTPDPPSVSNPPKVLDGLLEQVEELQSQLDQLRHSLAHAHRLSTLGTVSAIIAHEFNNILTPIISYAQLALARPDDHELMQKAVEKSLLSAERAAKISSAILGFTQDDDATASQIPVATIPQIVHDALDCLAREPRKQGIELELEIDSLAEANTSQTVNLSSVATQQILVNLILNAYRAMQRRGGRLAIRAALTSGGESLELSVCDTGPGVPLAVRERLFQPFVTGKIDPDPKSAEPVGTGLGLSICHDLISQAGGKIQLDPTPPVQQGGGGATFRIQLPVAVAA